MNLRAVTLLSVVAFYSSLVIGGSAAFYMSESSEGFNLHAELSPLHLLTWLFCGIAISAALFGTDRYEVTSDRAGLFVRFLAFIVDFHVNMMFVLIPFVLLVLIVEAEQVGNFVWLFDRSVRNAGDGVVSAMFLTDALLLIVVMSLPLSRSRRSAGAIIFGFTLKADARLSLLKSCLRTLFGFVSLAMAWLSVPIALCRQDRRMWHDRAYDVYPIRVRAAA